MNSPPPRRELWLVESDFHVAGFEGCGGSGAGFFLEEYREKVQGGSSKLEEKDYH
jgi:hypothetical protein